MKRFWLERTERERIMLIAMGAALAVFALYQVVYAPLASYNEQAARSYAAARALYAEIEAGAREAAALRASAEASGRQSPRQTGSVRAAVSATAQEAGLMITRMQPIEDRALNLWIDEADVTTLYRWIITLREDYGITVDKASIRTNEAAGTVRAQLLLAGSG